MKILMYSDLHISKTSSILPNISDSIYTYRQKMIIETGKYLANLADVEKPDLIINLGDTFDQHTVTSYDINVASEFFKCFRLLNIPHLVLVGNHEMLNGNFNAIALINNINNITVIDKPSTVNTNIIIPNIKENIQLAFLPYCDYKDILDFPEGQFLFSHQDIQGSSIRGNITLPTGIEPSTLKDKYSLVFNGHIHKPSILGNVVNVGSVTTHSFSDDNNSVPQCYIFDTQTMNLNTYKPTVCPLFRKMEVQTQQELLNYLTNLDSTYKYIIHCVCPFELKQEIKDILSNDNLVLNSRLTVTTTKNIETTQSDTNTVVEANIDIDNSFKQFLNEVEELKFPKQLYLDVLSTLER